MAGYTDLVKQAMKLTNDSGHLSGQVACVHGGEVGQSQRGRGRGTERVEALLYIAMLVTLEYASCGCIYASIICSPTHRACRWVMRSY